MYEPLFLATREKDSRKLQRSSRGMKYWATAEVPGEVWFMVEGGTMTSRDHVDVRRFITTNLWDALSLMREWPFTWKHLCAYVREPSTFSIGWLFQRVDEVHRFDHASDLLVRFSSGIMVTIREGQMVNERPVGVGQCVYPWQPAPV
jgi:hypothetical protein